MRNVNMTYMMRANWKGIGFFFLKKGMGLEWDDFLQHITWRIGSDIMRDFGIICDIHKKNIYIFIKKLYP